jgi:hypothetical protein
MWGSKRFGLVFGKCSVRISSGTLAMPTEYFSLSPSRHMPGRYSIRPRLRPCRSIPVAQSSCNSTLYRVSQEERLISWEVIVSVIPSKKVYTHVCPIPNGFWERAISLYSSLDLAPSIAHPSPLLRHCLKHVSQCEASVGRCDCW